MQPIRLAGALAAFALTTTLVGSAVLAQQSGSGPAQSPAQATPAWPAAIDGLRGLAEYFSGSRADDPLRALPSFEAYADDDEPGSRRGSGREDGGRRGGYHGGDEGRERRGGYGDDDREGPRGHGHGGPRGREDGGRRGGFRGEDEDRGRHGGYGDGDRGGPHRHGRGGPRGEMMARRAFGGLCGPYGNHMVGMMLMRLERAANPTEGQRAAFDKLKEAATKAGETARAGCPTERPFTPLGRLAAAEKRMEALLEAIRLVRPPLEEFFALLSEEQKARVYASGPRPTPPEGRRDWRERSREGDGSRRERWRDERRDGGPDPWRGRL